MRIVNKETFLTLPPETLYSQFDPYAVRKEVILSLLQPEAFRSLRVKGETSELEIYSSSLCDVVDLGESDEEQKATFEMLTFGDTCDGIPITLDRVGQCKIADIDADALFAVWEANDVDKLIDRLTRLKLAMESGTSQIATNAKQGLTDLAPDPVLA